MSGQEEGLSRARRILERARAAAGLAAYQYFFVDASAPARATYVSALETETEAQLLLEDLAGASHTDG